MKPTAGIRVEGHARESKPLKRLVSIPAQNTGLKAGVSDNHERRTVTALAWIQPSR